jgi:hypothetical protein
MRLLGEGVEAKKRPSPPLRLEKPRQRPRSLNMRRLWQREAKLLPSILTAYQHFIVMYRTVYKIFYVTFQ